MSITGYKWYTKTTLWLVKPYKISFLRLNEMHLKKWQYMSGKTQINLFYVALC